MRLHHSLLIGISFWVAACGGSQKPAEEPSSESAGTEEAEPSKSDAEDSREDSAAAADESKKEESSSDSSTSGPTLTRTPKDIVTMPDVVFMFSFNESDVKTRAEERCDKKAKDDPKKRADCMSKEKEKIEADGMRFMQQKDRWYWLTVRRKGKTLVNLHKLPIEFGEEGDKFVVLKPAGKDEGTLRGRGAPGETKVEVPNDYQIIINHPEHGRMVYEAKLGLIGEQER